MKQEITQEQFKELTYEQTERYVAWIREKTKQTTDYTIMHRSIGYLIWFLDEHLDTGWWYINKSRYPSVWTIYTKDDVGIEETDHKEIIDVLWEAVKTVLNQEHQMEVVGS